MTTETNYGYIVDVGLNVWDEHKKRREKGLSMTPGHWYHNLSTGEHFDKVAMASQSLSVWLGKMISHNTVNMSTGSERSFYSFMDFDDNVSLRIASLCHDWGKVDDDIWNPDGSPWFAGHEKRSAEIMVSFGFPEDHPAVVAVRLHGRCQQIDKMTDKSISKLVNKFENVQHQWMFFLLLICDCCGFSPEGQASGFLQAKKFLEHSDVVEHKTYHETYECVDDLIDDTVEPLKDFWYLPHPILDHYPSSSFDFKEKLDN